MEQITEQEIKNLMSIKGQVRGVAFLTDANYVRQKLGESGVVKLEEAAKKLGCEIPYKNAKTMAWYPLGWRAISLLAVKQAFNWGDIEIKDMGNCAPKYSFVATTMLKYFLKLDRVFQEAAKYWKKHYTIGTLEPLEIDEKQKFAILRLKEFKVHPILCHYFAGYFLRISQFVIKSEKITIEETECIFKGGPYDQFLVKWI